MPLGAFLTAPIRHRGRGVGSIDLANGAQDGAFSQADEETVVLSASRAALVIANARTRRADGREVALQVTPLAETLRTGELVRAEEIVFRVPDGRSITTLLNAAPSYAA